VLATEVDGVILIAEAGKTRRKELKGVVDQLRSVNANVIGVVLNRLKTTKSGYYYRYYDYYQRPEISPERIGGNGQDPGGNSTESTLLSRFRSRIGKSGRT
jgi:Mrp family chromosome partitioning ATPase